MSSEGFTVEEFAAMMEKAGCPEAKKKIEADIEEGAPVNEDGTINPVFFLAWECKQIEEA